jgi:hypothetical protein
VPRRLRPSRSCRLLRLGLVIAAMLSLGAHLFTVPFYAFMTPGDSHSIRLEHGRIEWEYRWDGRPFNEDWGIAPNSEPIDWRLDFHRYPSWMFVKVPLWIPFTLSAAGAAAMFILPRLRRPGPGQCARCGYDLRGLAADAACPECGRPRRPPPAPDR